jgi:hypothetical protein
MDIYNGDPTIKYPILVSGIPIDPAGASLATGTIPANTIYTIRWTSTPAQPQLSLWNFSWDLIVGDLTINNVWPDGADLTAAEYGLRVTAFTSLDESRDQVNLRVNKIIIINASGSSIPYWCYFKAYTFATSVGGNI